MPDGLSSLKSKIGKFDIGKLETSPVDLSKPIDVVKHDVVKKAEYDELVKKFNSTDTSKLVSKTDYNVKVKNIEDKTSGITGLVTSATINGKINEVKFKIPSVTFKSFISGIQFDYT